MSGIRAKDTKPEIAIRRALHRLGFRYRLHSRKLPGCPDLVLPRYRALVFVHGCFWHGHSCPYFKLPSSRPEFWRAKIERNRENDAKHRQALLDQGWRVATVWECATRGKMADVDRVAASLAEWFTGESPNIEIRQ